MILQRGKHFESLKYWKSVIEEILGNNITLGVVGNKIDLYLDEEVKENEGQEYSDSIGAKFRLTSAKNNPHEFSQFIEEMLEEYLKNNKDDNRKESIIIKKGDKKKEKEGGCC